MARKSGGLLLGPTLSILRTVSGAIAIDNASLIDANIPPAAGIDCSGYDTVLIGLEIIAGTAPTATIEALLRDADAADGSRWKRLFVGARPGVTLGALANEDTGALAGAGLNLVELRVAGHPLVFFRISAVANSAATTNLTILGRGGAPRNRPYR